MPYGQPGNPSHLWHEFLGTVPEKDHERAYSLAMGALLETVTILEMQDVIDTVARCLCVRKELKWEDTTNKTVGSCPV